MNTGAFFTCLNLLGIETGNSVQLQGIYSPASGTSSYLFNQLYSTGYHIYNGNLFAGATPLINVYNNPVTNNYFSGNNGFRAGYQHNGNFSVLMDIQYSGCNRFSNQSSCIQNVLLSTCDTSAGFGSGFAIVINDANRLTLKSQNINYTLSQELSVRDFVYVSLTENQYVNFGVYRPSDNFLYVENVSVPYGSLNTNAIYFGNFLSGSDSRFTGFFGNINTILLFSDDLSMGDVTTCATCNMVSGYTSVATNQTFSGFQLTGMAYSGVQYYVQTGSSYVTGYVTSHTGGQIPIVYPSGLMTFLTSGEVTSPLFNQVALQTSGQTIQFQFDPTILAGFSTYQVQFQLPLTSGDVLEISTYPQYNSNVALITTNNLYPSNTGYIQIFANGLAETLNQDYIVNRNQMSGFNESDLLSYDVLPTNGYVTAYSGYWQNEKLLLSDENYFPSEPQYYEPTGSLSGQVLITGLSGICVGNPFYPSFGYDIFMNGQKLVSGLQYAISLSGAGFVVSLSGDNLAPVDMTPLYPPAGGLPTGAYAQGNELSFLPYWNNVQKQIIFINTTVATTGLIGFSEQIWVNGIRQVRNNDYFRVSPCSTINETITFPALNFTIYNSENDGGYWNF